MELLHLGFGIFFHVFSHTIFHGFFEAFNGFAASVADAHFGFFAFRFRVLHQLLTALLGERRNIEANHLTIVFGSDAHIGVHNRLFNDAEHALIPRGNHDRARIGHGNICHGIERHFATVGIHFNTVQNFYICLTCTDVSQCFIQVVGSLAHLFFSRVEINIHVVHT